MMNQLIWFSVVLLYLALSSCKRKYDDTIVSGIVTDSISGAPLHGVNMQLKTGVFFYGTSAKETITDVNGYYHMVYDTPSEGSLSIPTNYAVFAKKSGYTTKRVELTPGTNTKRDFQLGEKYLPVKFTHYIYDYYNSDSTFITIQGNGPNAISDSWECYRSQPICPERNYSFRADTHIQIIMTRYKFGMVSTSDFTQDISGNSPITINLPL